ncbi:MAG: hypothetical protein P0S95_06910 [Rhabdochlamydiaceae bacterium]|nr:hypothetical protein [Candidatus Amphrikana amoebophyrae]
MAAIKQSDLFYSFNSRAQVREVEVDEDGLEKFFQRYKLTEAERSTIKPKVTKVYIRKEVHTKDFQIEQIPTDVVMRTLADHYCAKVSINILTCSLSELPMLAKKFILIKPFASFALILQSDCQLHVTPLYFHYNIETKKWYLFVLDSVDSLPLNSRINNLSLGIEDLKIVYSIGRRQADSSSCRMAGFQTIKWCHRYFISSTSALNKLEMVKVKTPTEVLRFDGASKIVTGLKVPSCWVPHAQCRQFLDTKFDDTKLKSTPPLSVTEYIKEKCLFPVDRTLMLKVSGQHFVIHDESKLNMRISMKTKKLAKALLGSHKK